MSCAGLSPLLSSGFSDRIRELLTALVAIAINRFRQTEHQRQLEVLSDRQLRDAGIDLSLAGRGKVAVINVGTLRRLQSLSVS